MANDMFSKLKTSVNRGIATISVKTSSSLEKSKLKTHVDTLSKDIEKLYSTVGEAAYKIWASGSEDFSLLNQQFETIKQKQNEIQEINTQLQSIDERDSQILNGTTGNPPPAVATPAPTNNADFQPQFNSTPQPTAAFQAMPTAPAQQPPMGAAPAPTIGQEQKAFKFCPSCGTKLDITAKFCKICGNKLS